MSLKAVTTGARRTVLISGEAGIGKTTLSSGFARQAFETGTAVLYGHCDEDLGIPYQPWAEAMTHLVASVPEALLAAHVEARGGELARLVPELANRVPLPPSSSNDGESERYLLFGAVLDLLARVSAVTSVVLLLDDLHWSDRQSVQLLRHVASADAPLRLLVIGTFRESDVGTDHPLAEALAAFHRESGIERIALGGLGDDELLNLLETTAGHQMTEDGVALRDALMAETEGNPFFVGEMLRHLAESGAIYQDSQGRWAAGPDLRTSGLPVSIREVVGRRVVRLGEQPQRVLTLASVIGRDFDTGVLARVAELDEDTVIDLCDQAVTAAVLTAAEVTGRYRFAHALIEHTLYDTLSPSRRARSHQRVAEALEKLCGADPGERVGELAYHWAHATQPRDAEKAMHYAQRAGDRALAMLAPDEALRWYRDALDLLDRAPGDDLHRRAALLLGLGDAQSLIGDAAHARPCSPPRPWPTTSTPSTSWYGPRCATAAGSSVPSAGSTTNASTWSPRRSPGSETPTAPTGPAFSHCCARGAHAHHGCGRATGTGHPSGRHGPANRRQGGTGRRHPDMPRGHRPAPNPRAPPGMDLGGLWHRRRACRPDHASLCQQLSNAYGAGSGRPGDNERCLLDLRIGGRSGRAAPLRLDARL